MSKQLNPAVPDQPIVLGKMGSTYGIRGWLRVFSSTENAESIFDYQPWFIQQAGKWQHVELEDWKRHSQDLIIKVKGVDDREAANLLTNCEIIVDSTQLPALEENDYYWKDLMGCQVVTTTGYELGKIIDMMETGSNDVMVVKANLKDAFGMKERLVPFLHGQVIKKVDLTAQRVEVDWDPGF
ncbi:ribosome maturation factor RimM [Yersinia pseudotuberculosis]|uniref:ribosome maturation factor RimM n=1 Tax=Yersinia pseudotuberculosis TaxID=633 RepID=UPI00034ABB7C|nr:ribosome maturation factor RimM [Yersinia pseudotuberculosis]QES97310.1 ribosome maturation factor RimM [Yersinia pseudotuberculosis]CFU93033.1 16S rRNA-processing protein RimM [Yersinia pseudotuberculosis]CNB59245.1 16S rRNA-processing protein RimM [Yersinia pseudotuberculosis]CNB88620.1 16S rRNA-processing protein RimM [Yersinia pseudotuberculosis]CRY60767.1 16S rRNA-processing protein RimM [Yersinia pseudotuberculosis]